MEVSAFKHVGSAGLPRVAGRSPLLRLQSDERLIALIRRGNHGAFEVLVSRYTARLLSFCRHLLGSREDAEDVLQEVFAAAFNAIGADERPINVRPWLYRIARNRSLNHLRRTQAVGVDSMDVHYSEHGMSTADQAHRREEFRLLVGDVRELPETQRSALLLREMDNLSYEQIAEAMDTTVPSVKSLLVRARIGLAEAAEARALSCDEVRLELGEVAEGLRKLSAPARRHVKGCERCGAFRQQLRQTNKALAAVLPIGPMLILKKLVLAHLGHTASGGGAAGATGTASATGSAVGGSAVGGGAAAGSAGGFVSAGVGAMATKAAAGLAAAALVTAGAVEVRSVTTSTRPTHTRAVAVAPQPALTRPAITPAQHQAIVVAPRAPRLAKTAIAPHRASVTPPAPVPTATPAPPKTPPVVPPKPIVVAAAPATAPPASSPAPVQSVSDSTTLPPPSDSGSGSAGDGQTTTPPDGSGSGSGDPGTGSGSGDPGSGSGSGSGSGPLPPVTPPPPPLP